MRNHRNCLVLLSILLAGCLGKDPCPHPEEVYVEEAGKCARTCNHPSFNKCDPDAFYTQQYDPQFCAYQVFGGEEIWKSYTHECQACDDPTTQLVLDGACEGDEIPL